MANAALQTDTIALVLGSCLNTAQKLKGVLEGMMGNRFKQAILVMAKEKEVLGLFDQIEKDKSSLMLCIQECDSNTLDAVNKNTGLLPTIQSSIMEMKDALFGKGEV
jgi:hypothetical protein